MFPVAVLLMLFLAACGEPATPGAPPPDTDPLTGRTFLSTEVTVDGRPYELVPGTEISVRFHEDGRITANAGCNHIGGRFAVGDGTLRVSDLGSTGMGCDEPRHEQDAWLATFLKSGPTWSVDHHRLVLSTRDTEVVLLDREVAEPDRELVGPTWAVNSLLEGDGPNGTASSLPADATATLVFDRSQVRISGACNSGSAAYTVSGDALRFERPVLTRKGCEPELMAVDEAIVEVLSGEATFEIDASRLTLTSSSGKGLSLIAR